MEFRKGGGEGKYIRDRKGKGGMGSYGAVGGMDSKKRVEGRE